MLINLNKYGYGQGDASFKAAGEQEGVTRLVDDFYDYMNKLPEAKRLRAMHPADLTESRTKLAYFLCGWLGGPRLYQEHFGSINIPGAHRHLAATKEDADAWMLCMNKAVQQQAYEPSFKEYLLSQLRVPADRVVDAGRVAE